MLRFGVNLLLFGDKADAAQLRRFAKLRDIGFDGVELPVFDPERLDTERVRSHAERNGLKLTVTGCPPPGARFYGKAAGPRRAAERHIRKLVQITAELGASLLCGPMYKPVGDTDESIPLAAQRRETARAFAPLAAEAQSLGVTLAFEPLNRFETNFLNTVADSVEFVRKIGSPAAGLLLDTFHMHIEEKDTAAALCAAEEAGALTHFHASENDRGAAGSGQVHWQEVAVALKQAHYGGWVVLESFAQSNTAIRRAVSCWRPFYDSPFEFCEQGLAFVKRNFE